MKISNFFKAIFILLIISIIIFLIVILVKKDDNTKLQNTEVLNEESKEYKTDLRLAVADFDTFNPILSENRNIYEISNAFYEPLISLDANYRKEYCLAEKIEKLNEKEYIVHLRDNVYFTNGEKLNSKDLQFSINIIKKLDSIYASNIKEISKTQVIDDLKLKLILSSPVAYFEYRLTFPVMQLSSEDKFKNKKAGIYPPGTGLYKHKEDRKNIMIFELNTNYWNKEKQENTKIQEIYITKFTSIGEVYNSFKSGNLDILIAKNKRYIDQIGTYGYKDIEYKGRDFEFIAINNKKFSKTEREVISLVIDKEKIAQSLGAGNTFSSFPTDFGHFSYNFNLKLPNDTKKAKDILAKNGYKLKAGKWINEANKTKLKIDVLANSKNRKQTKIAEGIVSELNNFGIESKVIHSEKYYNKISNRDFDLAVVGRRMSFSPDIDYFLGKNNIFSYENKEIIKLLDENKNEGDMNEFLKRVNKIYSIYLNDIPFIGISRNTNHQISSMGLMIDSVPNSYNMLYNINNWYRK